MGQRVLPYEAKLVRVKGRVFDADKYWEGNQLHYGGSMLSVRVVAIGIAVPMALGLVAPSAAFAAAEAGEGDVSQRAKSTAKVTLKGPKNDPISGRPFRVKGKAFDSQRDKVTRAKVRIQRKRGQKWKTVDTTKTNNNGRYRTKLSLSQKKSKVKLRAKLVRPQRVKGAVSKTLRLTFRQPAVLVPSAPLAVTTASKALAVRLTWQAPEVQAGLTGYRIQSDSGSGWTDVAASTGNVTTSYDVAVTRGVSYQFRVAAINQNGQSPWSTVSVPDQAIDVIATLNLDDWIVGVAVMDGDIYAGVHGDNDNYIAQIDPETFDIERRLPVALADNEWISRFTADNGWFYVVTSHHVTSPDAEQPDSRLLVMNAASSQVASVTTLSESLAQWGALQATNGKVYLSVLGAGGTPGSDGRLVQIDPATGQELASVDEGQFYWRLTTAGGYLYASADLDDLTHVTAIFDTETNALVKSIPANFAGVAGDRVYLVESDATSSTIFVVDARSHTTLETRSVDAIVASVAAADGYLYLGVIDPSGNPEAGTAKNQVLIMERDSGQIVDSLVFDGVFCVVQNVGAQVIVAVFRGPGDSDTYLIG